MTSPDTQETQSSTSEKTELPTIPSKRYFTISEVANLCNVSPSILRYWEQEFAEKLSVTRRNNRRYYQRHEVLIVRDIRRLLYDEGYTISGARNKLGGGKEFDSQIVRFSHSDIQKIRADLKGIIDIFDDIIK
ncbi:MerR family transcriptional regulator [Basilea psittacipulmonis]|uniref:Transcriptional regulator n=1 Tax=Basilea psittacipulmonis DSM 24701 TaxID=1072685 RepID=A0A077DDL4_9BURK|nr:MerR family transcriptional regulator [Basilea psittacipulmonis]AIL32970.1 transcriptional regulator [Basilea psittacipulmonis DSM 24701]